MIARFFLTTILFSALAFAVSASNLPMSKQATLVEVYSSSEISLVATGLGRNERSALADLQKAAVWFVLHNGTDPLLSDDAARARFELHQEMFFADVGRFITFVAQTSIQSTRVTLPDRKKGFSVRRNIRVNVSAIRSELERLNVITSRAELAEQIGLPFIMVIPETPRGQTPLEVFDSNPLARHSAGVIESFLTARRYDVVVPRALEQLNDLASVQSELKGADQDISYQLSLALGADIYITFSGSVQNNRASVVIRAYETTTARLLGSETGYSEARPGARNEALLEEAINGAIQNVLARITAHWQDDIRRGSQYKLVFNVLGNFSRDEIEELQFAVSDVIEEMFDSFREIIIADRTMDYLVWARNSEYSRASNIFRDLQRKLSHVARVTRITLNRKFIVVGLENKSE